MMKILVCGSRDWTDVDTIRRWLSKLPPGSIIVHGACGKRDDSGRVIRGADLIADDVAFDIGFERRPYPADWDRLGDAAGPARNKTMRDVERPDRGFAFTDVLMRGRGRDARPTGTAGMVMLLLEVGIPCMLVPSGATPVRT